jgi:Co/Zn/Cd efflux system component
MACCCHDPACSSDDTDALNSPKWRRALWIALAVNAGFVVTEIVAGAATGSVALQADALDFFGDAANYAVSLGVAGMALTWRGRAAVAKGGTMIAFAICVLASTAWHAFRGTLPLYALRLDLLAQ